VTWYSRALKQTATYWAPPIKDAWGAQTYPSPATMRAYWKEAKESATPLEGVERISKAIVLLENDVDADGFLYLGTLSAGSTQSPRNVPGASRIQQVEKRPTMRQDIVVYIAFL